MLAAAFSRDSELLATGDQDGRIKVGGQGSEWVGAWVAVHLAPPECSAVSVEATVQSWLACCSAACFSMLLALLAALYSITLPAPAGVARAHRPVPAAL